MGVINVTPDSFSDGGALFDPAAAIDAGVQMVEEGAGILDVGGESTRPGASTVDGAEERRRVLPVIEGLAARVSVPISIDTYKASMRRSQRARRSSTTSAVFGTSLSWPT
jgi:dihydropteroate synthase